MAKIWNWNEMGVNERLDMKELQRECGRKKEFATLHDISTRNVRSGPSRKITTKTRQAASRR